MSGVNPVHGRDDRASWLNMLVLLSVFTICGSVLMIMTSIYLRFARLYFSLELSREYSFRKVARNSCLYLRHIKSFSGHFLQCVLLDGFV